jgi:hypothetical protein
MQVGETDMSDGYGSNDRFDPNDSERAIPRAFTDDDLRALLAVASFTGAVGGRDYKFELLLPTLDQAERELGRVGDKVPRRQFVRVLGPTPEPPIADLKKPPK